MSQRYSPANMDENSRLFLKGTSFISPLLSPLLTSPVIFFSSYQCRYSFSLSPLLWFSHATTALLIIRLPRFSHIWCPSVSIIALILDSVRDTRRCLFFCKYVWTGFLMGVVLEAAEMWLHTVLSVLTFLVTFHPCYNSLIMKTSFSHQEVRYVTLSTGKWN